MDGLYSLGQLSVPLEDISGSRRPDMCRSYNEYIASGLYDSRYPKPNRRVLRTALAALPREGRFLDFGAGPGRYTLPLLALSDAGGIAYDISQAACATLVLRANAFVTAGRLKVVGGPLGGLVDDAGEPFDLVMLAFGVLGHVSGRASRLAILRTLRNLMSPTGTILLGLPNVLRRFRAEQSASKVLVRVGELERGDILYRRTTDIGPIDMFYHLYSVKEACRELADAGFAVDTVTPESILPESLAVSRRRLGRFDDALSSILPASLGYGLLITAHPEPDGATR
ncbi:MAG: class I SAM-dependent methyltransferase [Rhodospirillaceae bacterium]|nr:class I SAM-dependent methyltransferase [Rhodospirillaceae bacterium]